MRLDKWIWHARFYKSRSLAVQEIKLGRFRLNGVKVDKASMILKKGDLIFFSRDSELRAVRVVEFGFRRGPVEEAKKLYQEIEIK